jgi:Cdc6-like AAA superfamily ATPase
VRYYYIGIKGKRFGKPKEEALLQYFELISSVKGVVILIYDENDKLRDRYPKKKTT